MSEIRLSPVQTVRVVDSNIDTLHLQATWIPGGSPPPRHWHPRQDERFEITAGTLRVEVGGNPPRDLTAGQTLTIPRRTPHRMWNAGTNNARATWVITPPGRTKEMLEAMAQRPGPLRVARLLWRHRHETRLGPLTRR
ncbi:cupin domain-containing protein [Actinokineospora sp.]|uniref:cupin domain-containing protein n=1 Tax=Actinokineospora sp. TaxID=1872133 RepID=UPI0040383FD9